MITRAATLLLVLVAATWIVADAATPCRTASDCQPDEYCPSCLLLDAAPSSSSTSTAAPVFCKPRAKLGETCSSSDPCDTCASNLLCASDPFPDGAPLTATLASRCCAPVECPACPEGVDFVKTIDPTTKCMTSCTCNSATLVPGPKCGPNSHWNDCPACRQGCHGEAIGCGLDCRPRCECNVGFIEQNSVCIPLEQCPLIKRASTTAAPTTASTAAPTTATATATGNSSSSGGGLGGGGVRPGSAEPRNVNDPVVRAAAACGMTKINAMSNNVYLMTVANIVSATSQVVAGQIYHLRLLIGDTQCLLNDPTVRLAHCGLTENAVLQTVDVNVFVPIGMSLSKGECQVDSISYIPPAGSLASSTAAQPTSGTGAAPTTPPPSPATPKPVELPNADVTMAGKCAALKLSNVLYPVHWFALCEVATAAVLPPAPGSSAGSTTYQLQLVIAESQAPRMGATFSKAVCPLTPPNPSPTGGPTSAPPTPMPAGPAAPINGRGMQVVISYDPDQEDCTLQSYSALDKLPTPAPTVRPPVTTLPPSTTALPTTAAAVTTVSPGSLIGGLRPANVGSSAVQSAAACAIRMFNMRSNSLFFLALGGVVSARTQVVNGINYYLRLRVGDSTCLRSAHPRGGPTCALAEDSSLTEYDMVVNIPPSGSAANCRLLSWTKLSAFQSSDPTAAPSATTSSSASTSSSSSSQPAYLPISADTPGVVTLAKCGVSKLSVAREAVRPFFFVSLQSAETYSLDVRRYYRFLVDVGPSTCTMANRDSSDCLLVRGAALESFVMVVSTMSSPTQCTLEASSLQTSGSSTTEAPITKDTSGGSSTQWKAAGIVGICFGVGALLVGGLVVVLRMKRVNSPKKAYSGFSNPMYTQDTQLSSTGAPHADEDEDLDWA